MKNLTVSIETAKKMKAAWWRKPTAFEWVEYTSWWMGWNKFEISPTVLLPTWEASWKVYTTDVVIGITFAPTAQEILDVLPKAIVEDGNSFDLFMWYDSAWYYSWFYEWYLKFWEQKSPPLPQETLTEALALLRLDVTQLRGKEWYLFHYESWEEKEK